MKTTLAALGLALILCACGREGDAPVPPPPPSPSLPAPTSPVQIPYGGYICGAINVIGAKTPCSPSDDSSETSD